MTKRNAIVVAPLPPLAPIVRREPPSPAPLTRSEKKGAIEMRKQLTVIEQQRRIAIMAAEAIADMSVSQNATFIRSDEAMYDIVSEPGRPKELQEHIHTHYEYSVQRMSAYLISITDVGVQNIGAVVARGTYIEDTPPQGFLARFRREQ